MRHSRRTFLQQTSAAAGLGLLAQLPGRRLWAARPYEVVPEVDEAGMRELALAAIDAARAAGAEFADVRLTVARNFRLAVGFQRARSGAPMMEAPATGYSVDYGVRTLVRGAWGFANGTLPTTESAAYIARLAVEAARSHRPRHRQSLDLAPVPIVRDGRWETPIERDPLAVPFGEQRELAFAALTDVAKLSEVAEAGVTFSWRCPTIVFASTDGMLLMQRITLAESGAVVDVRVGPDPLQAARGAVEMPIGGYGYEVMRPATLAVELREAAEQAIARARTAGAPRFTPAEVGRYDLVLTPKAVAELLVATLGQALNLERALGFRANLEGTSFAAPPAAMLGQFQVASPLVTLTGDRSQPRGAATVGWDEEGVPPDEHTLIQDGVVMDYHTNRQTAVELADWYRGRGAPVRSHGCARRTGDVRPTIKVPNLTLAPGADDTTLEDLIADTRRGILLDGAGVSVDQQVLSIQGAGNARQITNGKVGDHVQHFGMQFVTPQFWKGLDALGGAVSAEALTILTDWEVRGRPNQPFPFSTVRAVPARVRQVNVLNVGQMR